MRRLLTLFVLSSSITFGQTTAKRPEFDVVDILLLAVVAHLA